MSRDGRLRELGKCCDQFSCWTLTGPQEVEDPAAVRVRDRGEDRVASGSCCLRHCVYDHEEDEGGWCIEKRLPSGSAKVAAIPQGYSSG
jgi:hypothetical protein